MSSNGFAMKDQRPNEFVEFKQIDDIWRVTFRTESMQSTLNAYYTRAIKALENEDHKNIMRDIKNNYLSYLMYCIKNETTDRFGVLSHGDFWNNNIMYKFNEKGFATGIRILDWSLMRYTSPSLDLLHNIFSSTDKTVRDKEFDNLLKLYHKSLSKTVELLGSSVSKCFTIDDLKAELKRCGNFALITTPMILQISLAESTTNEEGGQDFDTDLDEHAQMAYDQRINDVVEDIVKMGYYQQIHFDSTNEN